MKSKSLLITGCLGIAAVVAGLAIFTSSSVANTELALAELSVKRMTCGSCVATITEALQQVDGVQSVDVSVTTGRSQVAFDPAKIDSAQIAKVISAAGYPATLDRELTAGQYQALQAEEAQLGEIYVAKIGQQLLARDDFNQAVEQRMLTAGLQQRPETPSQVLNQTWQSLKQQILLLEDAERNQVVVQDGEVDLQIKKMRQQKPDLDVQILSRYGSKDRFFQQTKIEMIINRNIEEHVLAGVKDPSQRQARFNAWFQELIGNSPVVIYDTGLKRATSTSGGGGCGSGGGGCCG